MNGYEFLLPLNLWTRTELGQLLYCAWGLCWNIGRMVLQWKRWATVYVVMISPLICCTQGHVFIDHLSYNCLFLVTRLEVCQSSWYNGLPYHRLLMDGTERWWTGNCQGETKMPGKIAATVTISPSRPTNPLWLNSDILDVKLLTNVLNCVTLRHQAVTPYSIILRKVIPVARVELIYVESSQ